MKKLSQFHSEENKKGVHSAQEGEGADDQKYITLMMEYKKLRKGDKEEANKLLEKIFKLGKDGDVSKQAKIAGAYL